MSKKYSINFLKMMLIGMFNIFSCHKKKEPIKNNNPSEQKYMNNNKNKDKKDNKDDDKDEKNIIENNKKNYEDSLENYNVAVFEDTKNKCKNDEFLKRIIADSIKYQHFYTETEKIDINYNDKIKNNGKNNIEFQKQKTIESALHYLNSNKGSKIAILNFADWTDEGGCVNTGFKTQEESICRCTTLYQNLTADNVKEYYENHKKVINGGKLNNKDVSRATANNDLIYSPKVQIIKDDVNDWNVKDLEKDVHRLISVITCAAPWNYDSITFTNDKIYNFHYSKAKRILDVAINDNVDIIILGAYGCGDFHNNPEYVAKAYKKVLIDDEYQKYFKKVVFAIPILGDSVNYDAFYNVFNNGK